MSNKYQKISDAIGEALVNSEAFVVVQKVLASGVTIKKKIVDGDDDSGSREGNVCQDVQVTPVPTGEKDTWAFLLTKNMGRKEVEKKKPGRLYTMSVKAWLSLHVEKGKLKLKINEEQDKLIVLFEKMRENWEQRVDEAIARGEKNFFGELLDKVVLHTYNPIFETDGLSGKALMDLLEDKRLTRSTCYRAIQRYKCLL